MTPAEFAAFCPRGHRVVPSTGDCTTVRELQPDPDEVRVFVIETDACESLPPRALAIRVSLR